MSSYGRTVQRAAGDVCRSFPLCEEALVAGETCVQEEKVGAAAAGPACTLPTRESDLGGTQEEPVSCGSTSMGTPRDANQALSN
jgi:hypothetical protein